MPEPTEPTLGASIAAVEEGILAGFVQARWDDDAPAIFNATHLRVLLRAAKAWDGIADGRVDSVHRVVALVPDGAPFMALTRHKLHAHYGHSPLAAVRAALGATQEAPDATP